MRLQVPGAAVLVAAACAGVVAVAQAPAAVAAPAAHSISRAPALSIASSQFTWAPKAGLSTAASSPEISGFGIGLSPAGGPPTSTVKVSGAGFGDSAAVDIYFDTTDEALASTNANGAFSGIAISVPASAVPGTHWVTAVERLSGRSAQTAFKVISNWAEYRYASSHAGFNPYENVLSTSDVSGMGLDWSSSPTGGPPVPFPPTGGAVTSSPAVAKGVVYVVSGYGTVVALNAATGAPDWSYATGGPVGSSPAVANGVVYVGSNDGKVYALNAATGAPDWSYPTGGPVESSPAVANGVVYVGSDDGKVYAFSLPGGTPAGVGRPVPAALGPTRRVRPSATPMR